MIFSLGFCSGSIYGTDSTWNKAYNFGIKTCIEDVNDCKLYHSKLQEKQND
jgi:hypothetical protein